MAPPDFEFEVRRMTALAQDYCMLDCERGSEGELDEKAGDFGAMKNTSVSELMK